VGERERAGGGSIERKKERDRDRKKEKSRIRKRKRRRGEGVGVRFLTCKECQQIFGTLSYLSRCEKESSNSTMSYIMFLSDDKHVRFYSVSTETLKIKRC